MEAGQEGRLMDYQRTFCAWCRAYVIHFKISDDAEWRCIHHEQLTARERMELRRFEMSVGEKVKKL